jgi:hypothetical protein
MNHTENSGRTYFVTVGTVDNRYIIEFIIKENMAGSKIGNRFCRIIEGLSPVSLLSCNQENGSITMKLSCELENHEYVSLIQTSRHAITKSLESQQFILSPKT